MLNRFFRVALYFAALFPFAFVLWLTNRFGSVSLDQLLFHLQLGMKGFETSAHGTFWNLLLYSVLIPLVIASEFVRWSKKVPLTLCRATRALLLLTSLSFAAEHLGVATYIHSYFGEDYFSKNYINPKDVKVTEQHPKNLLLIYVESLEGTYSNSQLFHEDLLRGLNHFKDQSEEHALSFEQFYQMPGTGWTIAGMTATQCGVPLKLVTFFEKNIQGQELKHFLPNAKCLGDLLHEHGYKNVFLGGASLEFSGKGKFLQDHHYDEVYGRDEWIKAGYDPSKMNEWGLDDDQLLIETKKKLAALMHEKSRFNLTLLTVNTHPPGFINKTCAAQGASTYAQNVKCTANLIGKLIQYVHDQGWLDRIQVVVTGDHLAMKNPASDLLEQVPKRAVYNLFISDHVLTKASDKITHFDLYPSILDAMGLHVEGSRLGIGRSGFTQDRTLFYYGRRKEMREELMNFSPTYVNLWVDQPTLHARHPASDVTEGGGKALLHN